MTILKRLEDYLRANRVDYKAIIHAEAYTAQEIAAAMHVKGRELAKTVMIKADGRYIMTVLPASLKVDFGKFKEALNAEDARLVPEKEFEKVFPDCEPGAEPPFGNLYDIETVVDRSLAADENIFFNAGTHYEAVEMKFKDYENLVKPRVADIAARM